MTRSSIGTTPGATPVGGLAGVITHYVIVDPVDPSTFRSAESYQDATDGIAIAVDAAAATGTGHRLVRPSARAIDPAADISDDGLTSDAPWGFSTGDAVIYRHDPDDRAIGGLQNGVTYYVIADPYDPNLIALAATAEDAVNGTAITLDGSLATGIGHRLEWVTGLAVTADTDIFNFAFAEAGSSGSKLAIAGAVTVSVIMNTTTANLGSGVVVDSDGNLIVAAGDGLLRIALTGGVVAGESKGIGVGIGVDVFTRDTQAFVGAKATEAAGTAGTVIAATGPIVVTARNTGSVWAVVLAGASIKQGQPEPPPTATGTLARNAPGKAQQLLGIAPASGEATKAQRLLGVGSGDSGIAGAGDVAVIVLADTTAAAIHDTGHISTDDAVLVAATSDTSAWSLAGAVAILTTTGDSKGIAGSVSINIILGDTTAYVGGTLADRLDLAASKLDVTARRGGALPITDRERQRRHLAERQGRRLLGVRQHPPRRHHRDRHRHRPDAPFDGSALDGLSARRAEHLGHRRGDRLRRTGRRRDRVRPQPHRDGRRASAGPRDDRAIDNHDVRWRDPPHGSQP